MKTHFSSSSRTACRISRRFLPLVVVGILGWGIAAPAGAASIWNPTLLVNTESFNTIDDGDGTTNIQLRFGDTLRETITYNRSSSRFDFSRAIFVGGNITGTGSLSIKKVMSGAALRVDNNADIWGNLAVSGATILDGTVKLNGVTYTFPYGDGTASGKVLKTNAAGQLSWSADTDTTYKAAQGLTLAGTAFSLSAAHSGSTITASTALASSGTIAATGTIGTRGNITLNGDNGAANAVLTFGNDGGAETLQFNDSTNEFDLSDDLNVTGTLDTTDTITTNTNLTINADNGAADAVLTFGNDGVAETIKFNDTTNRFEMSDDLGVMGDLEVTGAMSGRTLQITGTGASPLISTDASNGRLGVGTTAPETKLEVVGTISGSTIAASTSLTSSGTLAVEGAAAFGSTVKLNGVTYTFPGGDGSASGKVLKTNAAGQLSWSADIDTDTNTTYAAGQGLTLAGTVFTLSAAHSGSTITASTALASSGTIAATGTIGTRGNITLNGDNGAANAVLTFGNDGGAETLQFNDSTNEFDLSDDLNVTGTLDATDTITTNTNLTINADNGGADATLTFGNNAGAETIKFNDTTNQFEVSDDLAVTDSITSSGSVQIESNLAVGGTIKLNGTAYTFPGTAGSNGQTLTTSGNGTLTWSAPSVGVGSGGVVFLSPEYPHAVYVGSGSSFVGQLSAAYDATNKENYYHWTSSKTTPLQEYTIAVRVRVPDNFSAWDANQPVQLRYRTGTAVNTENLVSLRMQDTAGAWVTLSGNENLAATSWTTATITGPQAAGTYTKAGYITLFIKLATTSAGSADAGYINLNWETSAP